MAILGSHMNQTAAVFVFINNPHYRSERTAKTNKHVVRQKQLNNWHLTFNRMFFAKLREQISKLCCIITVNIYSKPYIIETKIATNFATSARRRARCQPVHYVILLNRISGCRLFAVLRTFAYVKYCGSLLKFKILLLTGCDKTAITKMSNI